MPTTQRRLTVFISRLPGSEKTTLAISLREYLFGREVEQVVVFDGDVRRGDARG